MVTHAISAAAGCHWHQPVLGLPVGAESVCLHSVTTDV